MSEHLFGATPCRGKASHLPVQWSWSWSWSWLAVRPYGRAEHCPTERYKSKSCRHLFPSLSSSEMPLHTSDACRQPNIESNSYIFISSSFSQFYPH
ncbi:hypothetical protein PoMZ_00914 [Pyricularia oryzae]|uniref:Uncharacterized protein n=1 Tax=Pyricularia oryzae TaxID=318829 RepID=A0A4P7N0Z5_PYROR|nr:hypothetical protein PoMZ_00914 [Pyricularia oryzae]